MRDNFENHRLRTLLWIVEQLEVRPMSLAELNERWKRDVGLSKGMEIERRTFLNYIHAIEDMLHIYIECDRKNHYRYSIVDRDRSGLTKWMQKNFEQQLALERGLELGDRIVMEETPAGQEYLMRLIEAMKNGQKVNICLKEFLDDETCDYQGGPYLLRNYQQRWYVVLRDDEIGYCVLPLDRIVSMDTLEESFEMDETFCARDFFRYSFGIRVADEPPSQIRLKVKDVQCGYLRTLPLHHSQREVEVHKAYSIFELTVVPTVELTMKILSMGFLVEVLAPQALRDQVVEESEKLYRVYHK